MAGSSLNIISKGSISLVATKYRPTYFEDRSPVLEINLNVDSDFSHPWSL